MALNKTAEQTTILDLFTTGDSLSIEAGAGTGKTTALQMIAESTTRRGQYVAFNKSIVTEAGEKMPATVACSTAHSLAYRAVVTGAFSQRLRSSARMKPTDLALALRINQPINITVQDGSHKTLHATYLAGIAMRGVIRFCQSADLEPDAKHVPYIDGIDVPPGNDQNNRVVAKALVPAMRRAWADITDPKGSLPFRHDHYLKMWHLSGPKINADYILFDEAQDANPVLLDIVRQQTHAQLVWVGDSQQQIYSFTGAINALEKVGADHVAFLTQSFRFGPAIAEKANDVLSRLPKAQLRLTGTASIPSTVGTVSDPDAILCRTNARAVRHLLDAIKKGKRPHIIGGGREILDFAKAGRDLQAGRRVSHPELACFDSWGEVQAYVEQDEQGGDLKLMVNLIDKFGADRIIEALDRMPREEHADVVISTAHKAKGREWDTVELADDFPAEPKNDEELRLLYVAVTRAKLNIDVSALAEFFGEQPEDAQEPVSGPATVEADTEAAPAVEADESVSYDVIPEAIQLAMGELGEALMHNEPESIYGYIERALEHLRTVTRPATPEEHADLEARAKIWAKNSTCDPVVHKMDPTAFTPLPDPRSEVHAGEVDSRYCAECGADIVGNDPHAPGCPNEPVSYDIWGDGALIEQTTDRSMAIVKGGSLYSRGCYDVVAVYRSNDGELVTQWEA